MVIRAYFFLLLALVQTGVFCQVGINDDGSAPASSAILDIKSSDKGLLIPRLTTSRIFNISGPLAGLIVYNTDSLDIWCFDGTQWIGLIDNSDTLDPVEWVCGFELLYLGRYYETVQIGSQCWMAENLDAGTRINGADAQDDNDTIEKYCYNNDPLNCQVYGGLYQWAEAMDYSTTAGARGICPEGWHIPDEAEWEILQGTVDSQYGIGDPVWDQTGNIGFDVGGNLKETGNAHWSSTNLGATDLYGFTALPGGRWDPTSGSFNYLNTRAHIWTSSQYTNANYAWFRALYYNTKTIDRFYYQKTYGFSVRCLKD
jgi:uncharacterized protein (TIGR02145 family)